MRKYSRGFERDFSWYFSMRKKFTFSGDHLRDKKGDILKIQSSIITGVSAKAAFHAYESQGILLTTKHPLLLFALLKAKASANFHAKLYAIDLDKGVLMPNELREIYQEINAPDWFKIAVARQSGYNMDNILCLEESE